MMGCTKSILVAAFCLMTTISTATGNSFWEEMKELRQNKGEGKGVSSMAKEAPRSQLPNEPIVKKRRIAEAAQKGASKRMRQRPVAGVGDNGRSGKGTLIEPFPIVYSWSPRTYHEAVVEGRKISAKAISAYDPLPDVERFLHRFKEANLVYRDAKGNEKTIYDCVNDNKKHCAALDGRVSPDGTKVVFWVAFARGFYDTSWHDAGVIPIRNLKGNVKAQIHIYDLKSGKLYAWPTPDGRADIHPEWINNKRIVFVSNRSRLFTVYVRRKMQPYTRAFQRYTGNVDGSGVVNIGPHDDMVMHPYVLSDGNIISSNLRLDEELSQGTITMPNQWWLNMTDQHGGHEFTVFGAHGTIYKSAIDGELNGIIALHFYGERQNGDILTGDYYRREHVGGQGQIIDIERLPNGVEGAGSSLHPSAFPINQYGQEEDNPTRRINGIFQGKMSYPVGIKNNQIMMTYAKGYCYGNLSLSKANDEYLRGSPGCDLGIYHTTRVPSKNPRDLVKIVDRPDRHEFSPDIALPYAKVYGKAMPEQQKRVVRRDSEGREQCVLEVINVRLMEQWRPGKQPICQETGGTCIEPGFDVRRDLARFAIYEVIPNKVRQTKWEKKGRPVPRTGHEEKLLGWAEPEEDGSLAVEVPCETPIKMRGMTADGKIFVRDQIKHSLRSGETRRCIGCHGGHTEKTYRAVGGMGAWDGTMAARKSPQRLKLK